jgi:hypothetical protein
MSGRKCVNCRHNKRIPQKTFIYCRCEAVWASEIEEFCIAVTKLRFPEGDEQVGVW